MQKKSNFENFESAIYPTSGSMPLNKQYEIVFYIIGWIWIVLTFPVH